MRKHNATIFFKLLTFLLIILPFCKAFSITHTKTGAHTAINLQVNTNATLATLHLSAGTLSPAFSAATTAYTESVTNAVTSVTVTAKPAVATDTMKVNGTVVAYGATSQSIALSPGANAINVTVISGTASQTYTVTVTRAAASNDNLATLHLSAGTLSPAFAQATTAYTESVTYAVSSVTVTAKTADATANMKVNGTVVAYGATSQSIALNPGANTINIAVTAADGITTKTYSVTVTRAASSVATLATLHLSAGTLSPAFVSTTTTYTESVTNAVASVTITAKPTDANATMKVNGTVVAYGATSQSIALNAGANTINIAVTAADGVTTKTYTVTVTRAAAANALLSKLHLSNGSLSPAFNSSTNTYSASVSNAITSITVTPTAEDTAATIKVNGTAVKSGAVSQSLTLIMGQIPLAL